MYVVDKAVMQLAEKLTNKAGTDFFTLMKNAGKAAAEYIIESTDVSGKRILILCGKGNNGGDGFVMANHLSKRGANVFVVLTLGEATTEISKKAFSEMEKSVAVIDIVCAIEQIQNKDFDIIVDAIFGTGYNGDEPKGELKNLFKAVEKADFAVDIPSGLECDTSKGYKTALKANVTLTFGAKKLCHVLPFSADVCGKVVCFDIGIKAETFKEAGANITENEKPILPPRPKTCHKNSFGAALTVTGSYGMPGAAVLSGAAALRTGVGLLFAACIHKNYTVMATSLPEAVLVPLKSKGKTFRYKDIKTLKKYLSKASALLIGPGLSLSKDIKKIVETLLIESEIPIVLDADGINAVAPNIELLKKVKAPVIITPHPAEMARLCKTTAQEIEANRFKFATEFSKENGVITVLKGANTIIASPEGEITVNTNGNAGMATAGSGDVLSGIITALLANGNKPYFAAKSAVWLHSAAGDSAKELFGEKAMLPSDMIAQLHRHL